MAGRIVTPNNTLTVLSSTLVDHGNNAGLKTSNTINSVLLAPVMGIYTIGIGATKATQCTPERSCLVGFRIIEYTGKLTTNATSSAHHMELINILESLSIAQGGGGLVINKIVVVDARTRQAYRVVVLSASRPSFSAIIT